MATEPEEKKGENVRVALRVRPLSNKELTNGGEQSCVTIEKGDPDDGGSTLRLVDEEGKENSFAFDYIFGSDSQQEEVYEHVGAPALDNTLAGFNGTIFAYGQTGSGKTFCMSGIPECPGIIPRVNKRLFDIIANDAADPSCPRKYLVVCSFFEIYNEVIFDLINPPVDKGKLGGGLQIKEHPVLGIYVKDLTELVVTDAEKLADLMDRGQKSRAVSATLMNATSSRSHSVFTIKVHQKDEEDSSKNVFAKLNLVDLAGSERQKGTGASGQTLKEGANINKSLSALSNVINALVESSTGKKVFIPYRNSKLTRVLQESLGGNSLCTMLATLSPASINYEETLSTVRYANRAKAIKVSAKKNEEASQVSRLQSEVNELKKMLEAQQAGGGPGHSGMTEEEKKAVSEQYERQIGEMNQFMKQTWEEKAKLSRRHEEQLSRMQEERNRVAKKMEEERAKRWRLLQEQNDVQLSLKALTEAVQPLGTLKKDDPAAQSAQDGVLRTLQLLSPVVVSAWRLNVKDFADRMDELRAQREAVLVFKTAFDTDVSHWIDSSEYTDLQVHDSVSMTAITRALKKLTKLRATTEQLVSLTTHTLARIGELKSAVKLGLDAWNKYGIAAMSLVMGGGGSDDAGEAEEAREDRQAHLKLAEQDVARGMKLVARQVRQMSLTVMGLAKCDFTEIGDQIVRTAQVDMEKMEHNETLLNLINSVYGLVHPPEAEPSSPQPETNQLAATPLTDLAGTAEAAEAFMGQVISWDDLPKTKKAPVELLARPPPKFIYDVMSLVSETTGYGQEIFQEEAFSDWKNLESREAKVNFLTAVAKLTSTSLGCEPTMTAADVLKGVNTELTNQWFQHLAIAAAKFGTKKPGAGEEDVTFNDPTVPLVDGLAQLLEVMRECIEMRMKTRQGSLGTFADGEGGADEALARRVRELETKLEEDRLTAQRNEKKLLEKLARETQQRVDMEEEMDAKDRALETWENEHATKIEMKVSEVGLRMQSAEEELQEARRQNEALRQQQQAETESKFSALQGAVATLDDEGKSAAILAAMEEIRQGLAAETAERERVAEELSRLREEKVAAEHAAQVARAEADAEAPTGAKKLASTLDSVYTEEGAEGPGMESAYTPTKGMSKQGLDHSGAKRRNDAERGLEVHAGELRRVATSGGGEEVETELLEMHAQRQMQDTRLKQLEEKLASLDESREMAIAENDRLKQQMEELEQAKMEAVQALEVASEERDNLNAATEKLWEEKVRTEEELLNISNSYINLTDQLGAERDTAEEADDRVRQYDQLLTSVRAQLDEKVASVAELSQRLQQAEARSLQAEATASQAQRNVSVLTAKLKEVEDYGDDFENEADFVQKGA